MCAVSRRKAPPGTPARTKRSQGCPSALSDAHGAALASAAHLVGARRTAAPCVGTALRCRRGLQGHTTQPATDAGPPQRLGRNYMTLCDAKDTSSAWWSALAVELWRPGCTGAMVASAGLVECRAVFCGALRQGAISRARLRPRAVRVGKRRRAPPRALRAGGGARRRFPMRNGARVTAFRTALTRVDVSPSTVRRRRFGVAHSKFPFRNIL